MAGPLRKRQLRFGNGKRDLVMTEAMRRELDFVLYDWLSAEKLSALPAFDGQERGDWDAYLDLSGTIARNEFLPCYKAGDRHEPTLVEGRVRILPALADALRIYLDAGLQQATVSAELGGMGFPFVVATAAMAEFMAANVAGSAFVMLSVANARVLTAFGTPAQIEEFALPQVVGRTLGTMCLSEPDVGSSLGDVTTRALYDGEDEFGARYRITGRKMWISAGDQDVTDNIVHLVLAKSALPDGGTVPGAKGTTLFVIPTLLPERCGGGRNDVSVAGLNHKMGYRATPNCLLNFGEREGAIGWRIGAEGEGLRIVFQMMNEARINVGLSGAAMAYRGLDLSLRYASERIQGRSVLDKTAETRQAHRVSRTFGDLHTVPASVSKTCTVRFDNDNYSVFSSAVSRPVEIPAYIHLIVVRQDGTILGGDARSFGRNNTVYDPWYYVPVLAQTQRAAQRCAVPSGNCRRRWSVSGVREGVDDGDRQLVSKPRFNEKLVCALATGALVAD